MSASRSSNFRFSQSEIVHVLLLAVLLFLGSREALGICIDKTGKVLPVSGYLVEEPVPGWKFASDKKERYEQIAPNGKQYSICLRFSKQLIGVRKDGKIGFVDIKSGELVIPYEFVKARAFLNDLTVVKRTISGAYEVIDTKGNTIRKLPKQMSLASRQNYYLWNSVRGNGLLLVYKNKRDRKLQIQRIYRVKSNSIVKLPRFLEVSEFHEGLAHIRPGDHSKYPHIKNSKYGFIDINGKMVIPAIYDKVDKFVNGLAPVKKNNKWFYINKKGEKVIDLPDTCSNAGPFGNGLAAVCIACGPAGLDGTPIKRWGFIDTTGKTVIPPQFFVVGTVAPRFTEGLAGVHESGTQLHKVGFIDTKGNWAIKPRFAYAAWFSGGRAIVRLVDDKFSKEAWKKRYNRKHLIKKFLTHHKLIGMSKSTVRKHLGAPTQHSIRNSDIDLYLLQPGCTRCSRLSFEIHYSSDIVIEYRYSNMPEWYTKYCRDTGEW